MTENSSYLTIAISGDRNPYIHISNRRSSVAWQRLGTTQSKSQVNHCPIEYRTPAHRQFEQLF
jgi:hypothetical protein